MRVITKLVAVLIALEAVTSAQPALTLPAGHDMAVRMTNAARNAAARGKCALIDALEVRVRELDFAYDVQVFATDATIARCRPAIAPPGMVMVAAPPPPPAQPSAFTIEAGLGLGLSAADGEALRGLGGPAFGIGRFVTPNVALSLRVSGSLAFVEGTFVYVGVVGPNVQAWVTDNVWLGGGVGLAFVAGCGEGCDSDTGIGLDSRVGYAFRPRGQGGASLSVETIYESFGDAGVTTVAVMLGYQMF